MHNFIKSKLIYVRKELEPVLVAALNQYLKVRFKRKQEREDDDSDFLK